MRCKKAFLREEGAEFTRRKELASLKILIKLDVYALSLSLLLRKIQLLHYASHNVQREPFQLCATIYF